MPDKLPVSSKQILDHVNHGIVMTDLDGFIIYWNQGSEEIFGYDESEVVGQPGVYLFHPDNAHTYPEMIARFKQGVPLIGRWKGQSKEKETIWLDVRSSIIKNESGSPVAYLASICDIKTLKEVEDKLEESKARSEAIFETTVDAFISIDEKGTILNLNRAAIDIFGYKEEEMVGQNIKKLMSQPYREKHDEYINRYLETGEKHILDGRREMNAIRKNGEVFPIELTITEVKWDENRIFVGIIKDISEKRKLEKHIMEVSEEERRSIGRDLHDGLGQMLTGIRMVSENLARKLKANAVPGAEEVEEISKMVREADEFARNLSRGMVQVDIDKNGLRVALQDLCKRAEMMYKIKCEYSETGNPVIESHNMALNMYRITQEAINNAVRHGHAEYVFVRIGRTDKHISLIIEDNGYGFNEEIDNIEHGGMGIKIMKYRAGLMGGILEISRTEDNKTRVRCLIPIDSLQF